MNNLVKSDVSILMVEDNPRYLAELQEWLKEISGFAGVTLQPAAGAHGEFTGVLMMAAYHKQRGDTKRTKMLIPDAAHGTNPASAGMLGMSVVTIPSDERGNVDLKALEAACDDTVVGMMVTNPNTLGMFDEHIEKVVKLVKDCGGLMYGDGANLNALLGIVRPGDLGFDVMHFNLHKTFSVPHGGGGPGSGPVGVSERLLDFLPSPLVGIVEEGDDDIEPLYGFVTPKHSIGRMKAFHGHFGGGLVRAYTYIAMHGPDGLKDIAQYAVLNANYLQARLRDTYKIPYDRICMHEFVMEGRFEGSDIRALDISKRLMDYNFHPPTNYFPLIVHEALMIEPTETENKDTLDAFAEALIKIAGEARENDLQVFQSLGSIHGARHPGHHARIGIHRVAEIDHAVGGVVGMQDHVQQASLSLVSDARNPGHGPGGEHPVLNQPQPPWPLGDEDPAVGRRHHGPGAFQPLGDGLHAEGTG